jgi:hypothetical protein
VNGLFYFRLNPAWRRLLKFTQKLNEKIDRRRDFAPRDPNNPQLDWLSMES